MKLYIGILLTSLGIVLFLFGKPLLVKEYSLMQSLPQLSQNIEDIKIGDQVIIEGKVSLRNATSVQNLVIGNLEEFTGTGRLNGWKVSEKHLQPIILDLPSGKMQLTFENVPDRGSQLTVIPTEKRTKRNMHIRYKGIEKLAEISAIASIVDTNPLIAKSDFVYVGSNQKHLALLKEGNEMVNYICAALLILGLGFIFWHYKSKN